MRGSLGAADNRRVNPIRCQMEQEHELVERVEDGLVDQAERRIPIGADGPIDAWIEALVWNRSQFAPDDLRDRLDLLWRRPVARYRVDEA